MAKRKIPHGNIKSSKALAINKGTKGKTAKGKTTKAAGSGGRKRSGSASKAAKPKYDESTSAEYVRKEYLVRRLNERIASVVRHAGAGSEEVTRWQAKLTRPNSPYISKVSKYDPSKIKKDKNKLYKEATEYQTLSRRRADIEKMDYNALLRLDEQTRGWGQVKAEAKKELMDQARMEQDLNPFIPANQRPSINDTITEEDVIKYINQKEVVREYIEGSAEAFYALIESTGWTDIREHTTEEIYNKVSQLDMSTYKFKNTLKNIGSEYIKKREAGRERRRQLGI